MKKLWYVAVASALILSCAKTDDHAGHEQAGTDDPNQILYNEVMDIHDEVMPRMEDLYNLKKELQDKVANTAGLVEEEKKRLEDRIIVVDSVSKMMMDWMHEFDPLPDSVDKEAAREYLESEMEKIKKVKEAMIETLEKGSN